jgi:hypothetical protein
MEKPSLKETLFPKKPMNPNSAEWWTYWSDILKVAGFALGAIVTLVAIVGWAFSMKASKLKDIAAKKKEEAFELFKLDAATSIAKADAKAAEANKIAAIANERAAASALELERITNELAPRGLSDEQRQLFSEVAAASLKPGMVVEFAYLADDREARGYAKDLRSMLVASGCKVPLVNRQPRPDSIGLTVRTGVVSKEGNDLMRAFRAAGIRADREILPVSSSLERLAELHTILIIVGRKQ